MRWSVLALNIVAIVAFATPALLIFASSAHHLAKTPVFAGVCLASLLIGCASLFASMFKLRAGRTALAFGLMLAGLGLVGAPLFVLVLQPF